MTSTFSKALNQVTGGESVKSKISKATQDDESPTPGYLQEELKKLTHDSTFCCEVEDHILSRLSVKSSNVKLKSLRLIKVLCERGSPNFKRDLQRRITAVRECLHWTCETHPTLGDLPCKMVREAAQEAVNAIFSAESAPAPSVSQSTVSSQSSVSSTAPTSASVPRSGGFSTPVTSSSNIRYEGFGSNSNIGGGKGQGAFEEEKSILSYASSPSVGHHSNGGSSRMPGFGNVASAAYSGDASKSMEKVKQVGAKAASLLTAGLSQLTGAKEATGPNRPGFGRGAGFSGSSASAGGYGGGYGGASLYSGAGGASVYSGPGVGSMYGSGGGSGTGRDWSGLEALPPPSTQGHVTPSPAQAYMTPAAAQGYGTAPATQGYGTAGDGAGGGAGQLSSTWGQSRPVCVSGWSKYQEEKGKQDSTIPLAAYASPAAPPAPLQDTAALTPSLGSAPTVRPAGGVLEQQMVAVITAAGGVRVAPPREELRQFCRRVATLDAGRIVELLMDLLSDSDSAPPGSAAGTGTGPWQGKVKALHVLDALLRGEADVKSGGSRSSNPSSIAYDMIRTRGQVLESLSESSTASLADMANKVLQLVRNWGASAAAEVDGGSLVSSVQERREGEWSGGGGSREARVPLDAGHQGLGGGSMGGCNGHSEGYIGGSDASANLFAGMTLQEPAGDYQRNGVPPVGGPGGRDGLGHREYPSEGAKEEHDLMDRRGVGEVHHVAAGLQQVAGGYGYQGAAGGQQGWEYMATGVKGGEVGSGMQQGGYEAQTRSGEAGRAEQGLQQQQVAGGQAMGGMQSRDVTGLSYDYAPMPSHVPPQHEGGGGGAGVHGGSGGGGGSSLVGSGRRGGDGGSGGVWGLEAELLGGGATGGGKRGGGAHEGGQSDAQRQVLELLSRVQVDQAALRSIRSGQEDSFSFVADKMWADRH